MVDGPTLVLSYHDGLRDPFSELFASDMMIFVTILVNDVLQDLWFLVCLVAFCGLVNCATSHILFDIPFFLL